MRREGHTIRARPRLTLWNMVKVPSSRKPTIKGKEVHWDLKGESLRSKSSKENASTMGSKVINLRIADC